MSNHFQPLLFVFFPQGKVYFPSYTGADFTNEAHQASWSTLKLWQRLPMWYGSAGNTTGQPTQEVITDIGMWSKALQDEIFLPKKHCGIFNAQKWSGAGFPSHLSSLDHAPHKLQCCFKQTKYFLPILCRRENKVQHKFMAEQRTEPTHPWATLLHPQDATSPHQTFNSRALPSIRNIRTRGLFIFPSSAFSSYLCLHSGCAVDREAELEGIFIQHIIQCLPVGLHM